MYDGTFIFPNTLTDENVEKLLQRVQGEITRAGGTVQNAENLGRRQFSRKMKKRDSGFFSRIRFEMDPAATAGLQARLKLIEDIFRVQIVRAAPPAPEPAKTEGAANG